MIIKQPETLFIFFVVFLNGFLNAGSGLRKNPEATHNKASSRNILAVAKNDLFDEAAKIKPNSLQEELRAIWPLPANKGADADPP